MRIARELRQMGFEVVAVDSDIDKDAHERLHDLDVPLISGDARNEHVLQTARLDHATAAIVCTSDDYVNLEVTMRMRDMNESARLVTRMWDKRLAKQIERFLNVEVLSASDPGGARLRWRGCRRRNHAEFAYRGHGIQYDPLHRARGFLYGWRDG